MLCLNVTKFFGYEGPKLQPFCREQEPHAESILGGEKQSPFNYSARHLRLSPMTSIGHLD